jgi:chromosomal replication initiator protein
MKPRIADIQAFVADWYDVPLEAMLSRNNQWWVSRPRQMAMAVAHNITRYSYRRIALKFNRTDHTTVIHAIKHVHRRAPHKVSQLAELIRSKYERQKMPKLSADTSDAAGREAEPLLQA